MKTGKQRKEKRRKRQFIAKLYARKILSGLRRVSKTLEVLNKDDEAHGEGSIVTFKKYTDF